jgi:hypothetical protein
VAGAGGGFISQAAEDKALSATMLSSGRPGIRALKPQSNVTQPTMCFKCFPLLRRFVLQEELNTPFRVTKCLFALI